MFSRISNTGLRALKPIETMLALLFGVCFGVYFHAYVLIDFFPVTGRRLLALTCLAFLFAGAGSYFLFSWIVQKIRVLTWLHRVVALGLSLVLSLLILFTSSDSWSDLHRYPSFVLPSQSIELRVDLDKSLTNPPITIEWMTTPLGEISFSAAQLQGWQRQDDRLVLTHPDENRIGWQGKTGDYVQFVIRSGQTGMARVTANGEATGVMLDPQITGGQTITIARPVPFYATRIAAQITAVLVLWVLLFALIVLWNERTTQYTSLFQRSISRFSLIKGLQVYHPVVRFESWEGRLILILISGALLLRSIQLDNLFPYVDEYAHILAAKNILLGEPILSVYRRSLFIVTLPVTVFFKLFGFELWAARLPGIIINALAILPLYLVARKMNRPIAIIASLLYVSSPWVIAVARDVREYAYYPFYFFWILYAMLIVLQKLPNAIVIDRHFWKQNHTGWLVPLLLLSLPVIYVMTIDRLSTFRVVFIAYVVFALFLLAKLDWTVRRNLLPIFGLLVLIVVASIAVLDRKSFIFLDLEVSIKPLLLFFPNPQQQWYYNRLAVIPLIAILLTLAGAFWQYRHNIVPLFLTSILAGSLVFFTFFFWRYFRPRYIFSLEAWYIICLSFGIYLIWLLLKTFLNHKWVQIGIAGLLLLVSFNPSQTVLAFLHEKSGFMPVTDEAHYDLTGVDQYIQSHMQLTDALIATYYGNYVRFNDFPHFQATRSFSSYSLKYIAPILAFMEDHPTGWIVVDQLRYKETKDPLPLETLIVGDFHVEYISQIDEQYVWRWHPNGQ